MKKILAGMIVACFMFSAAAAAMAAPQVGGSVGGSISGQAGKGGAGIKVQGGADVGGGGAGAGAGGAGGAAGGQTGGAGGGGTQMPKTGLGGASN